MAIDHVEKSWEKQKNSIEDTKIPCREDHIFHATNMIQNIVIFYVKKDGKKKTDKSVYQNNFRFLHSCSPSIKEALMCTESAMA